MLGSEIKNLVIVKLDEYSPYAGSTVDGPLVSGGDVLDEVKPIESYITKHLAEAADEVLLIAPVGKLIPKECSNTPEEDVDDMHIGRVRAPLDYLRLHTFRMDGWKKPVHQTAKPGTAMYAHQFCPWTRGHMFKPVVTEDGARIPINYPYYVSTTNTAVADIVEEFKTNILEYLTMYNVAETFVLVGADNECHKCEISKIAYNNSYINVEGSYEKYFFDGYYVSKTTDYNKWYSSVDDRTYYTLVSEETTTDTTLYILADSGDIVEDESEITNVTIDKGDKPNIVSSSTVSSDNFTYLHYYSVLGDHEIKQFLYIPHFTEDQTYDDGVAELIALNCANKVCEVFERADSLTIINKEMQSVLQSLSV